MMIRIYEIAIDTEDTLPLGPAHRHFNVVAEYFTEAVLKAGKRLRDNEMIRDVRLLASAEEG